MQFKENKESHWKGSATKLLGYYSHNKKHEMSTTVDIRYKILTCYFILS